MAKFRTEKRYGKISAVLSARQFSLNVVIENVHDPHNVSAIYRTCDAVGVPAVSLIYNNEQFPKISKTSSASAFKWVDKEKYEGVEECYSDLRSKGFKIYASLLDENSVDLYDLDLTGKVAFVMGNEKRGVSEEAAMLADKTYYIPMFGMIQSLNVSVATAVTLYEAMRQRRKSGQYDKSELSDEELTAMIDKWCKK
ncbi:MAG: RNA methyltransferase [Melioribacteraceae bacterium]|nr:RNA methyltransferase [Melioribacteraceae bacterium]MCF8263796.1 RNA methyltransferase [Melioribacteraceae bacterium]MCF8412117.1 RNA methyltransferase [Melioribacteraceae bacterium]